LLRKLRLSLFLRVVSLIAQMVPQVQKVLLPKVPLPKVPLPKALQVQKALQAQRAKVELPLLEALPLVLPRTLLPLVPPPPTLRQQLVPLLLPTPQRQLVPLPLPTPPLAAVEVLNHL